MNLQSTTNNLQPNRGFSLIEMLVVMGIFALLSTTVFINYSDFSVKASLDNLTHQVALIIRQAQVYGISVSQGNQFRGYGVHFSVENPASQSMFTLFNDRNPSDKKYSPGANPCNGDINDECLEKISIRSGDTISLITAKAKTDPQNAINLKEVHIVFTRPNPDANILGIDFGNNQYDKLADVQITLKSLRLSTKKVIVWSTGQIAVE